jgi:ribulose-bisphosphate carboxylase large chain
VGGGAPRRTGGDGVSDERILATYLVETPGEVERVAEQLVGEQGVGRADRGRDGRALAPELRGTVAAIRPLAPAAGPTLSGPYEGRSGDWQRAEVDVAVPLAVTGTDLLNVVATLLGNVFELREACGLRLLDFSVPDALARALPGPSFGVEGTRATAGVHGRPLIGSIVKPSVGLTPRETADLVRELGLAGIDFVKDDELMTGPRSSPVSVRVREVGRALDEVAERTGRKPLFAFNVSSDDPDTMRRNHDAVVEAGGTCVMVSLNQVGLGAFMEFRRRCALPIHGHRNGWGMLTRSPGLGMDFRAYRKVWGLAGADQLHCNGFSNKFFEADESVARSIEACLEDVANGRVLPVLSSGQWGGQAPATYARTRTTDLLYLAGGGIQGHPGGLAAGVSAIRAAWDGAVAGETLEQTARAHPALAQSIETFGGRVGSA